MQGPNSHRHSRATGRARRAIAPIPFGPKLWSVWALLLGVATLAAALDLRWWLGLALLLPGILLQVRLGRRSAEARGIRERALSTPEFFLPGIFGAALAWVAGAADRRYFALILVAGLILVVDPVMRWQWKRRYGVRS